MRFVVVNDRTPRLQSFCVLCCEPLGTSYLREIGTRLSYCDHNCYAQHCKSAVLLLETSSERFVKGSAVSSDRTIGLGGRDPGHFEK
jgi:hypothetical protein